MRALRRPDAPTCLSTETEERAQAKRERYANHLYPSGGFRALWNDLERDEAGVGAVRRALLAMSDNACAYCELHVYNDHMQVDHVLPKEDFPFIAYAWENLLPSCAACNRRKSHFVPESLRGKSIIEVCLQGYYDDALVFDKPLILGQIARDDRMVDPSFDDPASGAVGPKTSGSGEHGT